jgi:hypothetical protein
VLATAVGAAIGAAGLFGWDYLDRRRRARFPRQVWIRAYGEQGGAWHNELCLVARHPDPATWDTSGFPWCTCAWRRRPQTGIFTARRYVQKR